MEVAGLGPELVPEEVMLAPEEGARHVTIWNRTEGRKIAGNAAPLRRNLERYLSKHPDCEVYSGQDKLLSSAAGEGGGYICPVTGERMNEHVPIWHKLERRKVTGNAAPLKKNYVAYLAKHPEYELYNGQDKRQDPNAHPPPPPSLANSHPIHVPALPGQTAAVLHPGYPGHPTHRATAVSIASAVTGANAGAAEPLPIPQRQGYHPNDAAHGAAAGHHHMTPPLVSSWSNAPFWPSTAAVPIPNGSVGAANGFGMSFGATPPGLSGFLPGQTPTNPPSLPPSFDNFRDMYMHKSRSGHASGSLMTDFSPSNFFRPPPTAEAAAAKAARDTPATAESAEAADLGRAETNAMTD